MFFPMAFKGALTEYMVNTAPLLNPDVILDELKNEIEITADQPTTKLKDPALKPGVVGEFCRTYTISQTIENFLSDIYTKDPKNDKRYTYAHGTGFSGLVVYDDDKLCYSHHQNDPARGKTLNAFDLVRIHRFGYLDKDGAPDTLINKLPSYLEMEKMLGVSKHKTAKKDITPQEDGESWEDKLKKNKNGKVENCLENIVTILENDEYVKGLFGLNLFADRIEILRDLPEGWSKAKKTKNWEDVDDNNVAKYLSDKYNISSEQSLIKAVNITANKNAFHPIIDYLESLPPWDNTPRVDRLFIDYFGADDIQTVRQMSRKTLVAAIARLYKPGCEFDNVLTLLSRKQGIGKTTFWKLLAGREFYGTNIGDIQNKEALERSHGKWLIELQEVSSIYKKSNEVIKSYLSVANDYYRKSYDKRASDNPRQFIYVASTNNDNVLTDTTGNRRFWIVKANTDKTAKNVWRDLPKERDQIWAEALYFYRQNEPLFFTAEEEMKWGLYSEQFQPHDDLEGVILEFLEKKISRDWYELPKSMRQGIMEGDSERGDLKYERRRVCMLEIWHECFGNIKPYDSTAGRRYREIMRGLKGWQEKSRPIWFGKSYGVQRYFERVDIDYSNLPF
jgi:predicted P-loop ATPase